MNSQLEAVYREWRRVVREQEALTGHLSALLDNVCAFLEMPDAPQRETLKHTALEAAIHLKRFIPEGHVLR